MADQDQEKSPCTGSLTGNCGSENLKVTIVDNSYRRGADTGSHSSAGNSSRNSAGNSNSSTPNAERTPEITFGSHFEDDNATMTARKAMQLGSSVESAGQWVEIGGTGVTAVGAVTLQPEVVALGATGVAVGTSTQVTGISIQLAAGYYLWRRGDHRPLLRFAASHAFGPWTPPALPGEDPASRFGDQLTNPNQQ